MRVSDALRPSILPCHISSHLHLLCLQRCNGRVGRGPRQTRKAIHFVRLDIVTTAGMQPQEIDLAGCLSPRGRVLPIGPADDKVIGNRSANYAIDLTYVYHIILAAVVRYISVARMYLPETSSRLRALSGDHSNRQRMLLRKPETLVILADCALCYLLHGWRHMLVESLLVLRPTGLPLPPDEC